MLNAILTGSPYPSTLFTQVEIRIRAEKEINRGKAAIIKAYLRRNVVEQQRKNAHVYEEVLGVELNISKTTYLPSRLGRLFAVLEALQLEAFRQQTEHDNQRPVFQLCLCDAGGGVSNDRRSSTEVFA